MTTETIYPRFLGVDSNGDFVWELASGRWTWGDTPFDVNRRKRTFTPDRYLEKYGPLTQLEPSGLLGHAPVPAEPVLMTQPHDVEPGLVRVVGRTSVTAEADKLAGAVNALAAMERAAKGWADGAAENQEAMGHRDRLPSDQQPFVLADILNMIDDAAREVGVAPVYSEGSKRP